MTKVVEDFKNKTYTSLLNEALELVPDTLDKRESSIVTTAIAPIVYQLAQAYNDFANGVSNCFGSTATGDALTAIGEGLGIERSEGTAPYIWLKFTKNDTVQPASNPTAWLGNEFYFEMSDGTKWNFTIELFGGAYDEEYEIFNCFKCSTDKVGNFNTLASLRKSNVVVSDITAIDGCTVEVISEAYSVDTTTYDVTYNYSNYGSDAQSDDEYREYYLNELKAIRFGGNISDYLNLPNISKTLSSGKIYYSGGYSYTSAYPFVTKLEVVRGNGTQGTLGTVYLMPIRRYTTEVGGGYFPYSTYEKSLIKEELDPTSYQGEGNGLLPIGHTLVMGSVGVIKYTATIAVTGNTISTDVIDSEVTNALYEYCMERNDDEFTNRSSTGTYPDMVIGYNDILTAWGNAYRSGYGALSSITVTKWTEYVDGSYTGTDHTVNWTDSSGKTTLSRTYNKTYVFGSSYITVTSSS